MMSDEITDLKQFISSTIAQQTAELEERISGKIGSLEKRLTMQIEDISNAIAESLDISNNEHQKQLNNHEERITKLELSGI